MSSKLNCKIGDLAIVVSTELPQNVGQIVEVLGLQNDTFDLSGQGHIWHVRTVSGRSTLHYRRNRLGGRIDQMAEGPAPDRCLRPVSGLARTQLERGSRRAGKSERSSRRVSWNSVEVAG